MWLRFFVEIIASLRRLPPGFASDAVTSNYVTARASTNRALRTKSRWVEAREFTCRDACFSQDRP